MLLTSVFSPNTAPPPLWASVPLLRNTTISSLVPFATGHLDAGISAEHMLHSKQPQHNTEQDNKTQPWAKAFPPKSKCCSQPKVPSIQVQLAFCSWRSSKSHSYSLLNITKWPDSFQIQPEYLGTVGPHNREGKRAQPIKIGPREIQYSFPWSECMERHLHKSRFRVKEDVRRLKCS